MAKKTCTCQQTPADPERRWVGDACQCEAKAMTVGEAKRRLAACGKVGWTWIYHHCHKNQDEKFNEGWKAQAFLYGPLPCDPEWEGVRLCGVEKAKEASDE